MMIVWGIFWGAVLGLFWRGHGTEFNMFVGAVLGALAGFSLRRTVRSAVRVAVNAAVKAEAARASAAQAAASIMQPASPQPAQATAPASISTPEPVQASVPIDAQPARLAESIQPPESPEPAAAQAPRKPLPPARPDLVTVLVGKARDWLFGGNTVVRMGVLVLFVGLAFLAKYAAENSLLPPSVRLAAIAAAGLALFVTGFRLRRKATAKPGYAVTLQGAGIAVLYLTVFAAFRLYQFMPAGMAFVVLGLICVFSTVIALAQNAQAMAWIGFAGGFAAPLLVSTGQGNHVALFSYYTLLGIAIASIAWLKAWRALNLLGFFATFGIATLWGALKYQPEHLATTEPFLIGFFAIYLLAALLYALRHSLAPKQAVDATLLFGTPIAALGLQAALVSHIEYAMAFSSLALGALYLGLGWWLMRRQAGTREVSRWLAECFAALGLGFVTLAVPLALDGRWTSAVWAVEGAGVYWMGRRQARWLPRAAGLLLQAMAAFLFLGALQFGGTADIWPLANPRFVGAAMLAGAALAIAWWAREPMPAAGTSTLAAAFQAIEAQLSPILLWIAFAWSQFALHGELARTLADAEGMQLPVLAETVQLQLQMLAWVATAFALHHLALPQRARPWPMAATPAWTVVPAMLAFAVQGLEASTPVGSGWTVWAGWLAWPLALVLHGVMLRRLDGGEPRAWWPWVHAGGVWLVVLLGGQLLVEAISKAALWQTAWATVILLVSATAVLLVLGSSRIFAAVARRARWPLDRFGDAYVLRAASPLFVLVSLGALVVAVYSRGNAQPLPYVPLLNPTDLAVGLALASCTLWLIRLRSSKLAMAAPMRGPVPLAVLAGIGFVAVNTVWLRVAHHYANVPWDAGDLFSSFLVQAGYSILWTAIALVLMVAAHRRAARTPWMAGAGLLGFTVLKLFIVDLSNRGGSERIIVFIAVGLLMLVVGYFAPLPPAAKPMHDETPPEGALP